MIAKNILTSEICKQSIELECRNQTPLTVIGVVTLRHFSFLSTLGSAADLVFGRFQKHRGIVSIAVCDVHDLPGHFQNPGLLNRPSPPCIVVEPHHEHPPNCAKG